MTDEQKDIRKAARKFAEGEFPDLEVGNEGEFREIWKKGCELGFVGATIPREYGGSGLGLLDNALIVEEFYRVNPRFATFLISSTLSDEVIEKFGSVEILDFYDFLPRFSEP